MSVPWKEVAVVFAVGAAMALVVQKVPVVKRLAGSPVVVGAALYTVGYLLATKRPAGGYPMLAG
jgi:hypothetical protein